MSNHEHRPIILPMNDIWYPYSFNEAGEIEQRKDTVGPGPINPAAGKSPDVAAILAAENARLRDEAAAAAAKK